METMNLSDCTYECIKKTFYYGIFGDFKLVVDKSTGYFNATKLCEQGGKNFFEWKRLEKSKKLIEYYQKSRSSHVKTGFETGQKSRPGNSQVGFETGQKSRGPHVALGFETKTSFDQKNWDQNSGPNLTYEVKGDNKDKANRQITGTYVPKELILDIASWVSVEFYDKCNSIIINYFINQYKSLSLNMLQQKVKEAEEKMVQLTLEKTEELKVKDDKIDELKEIMLRLEESREKDREYMKSLGISLEEVKDQNEELLDKTKGLKKQNKSIQRKLGIAVEERAPLPKDKSKCERFVLLKRNDSDFLPYYVIRAQNLYTTRKLKIEKQHFPNLEVLLDFTYNPNSKTLYTRIKEDLKSKGVVFNGNNIDLEDTIITELDLMEYMNTINNAKRDV